MLNEKEIKELVKEYGSRVNEGRPIRKIIEDGYLPRLSGSTVLDGKVSDSVFGQVIKTKNGKGSKKYNLIPNQKILENLITYFYKNLHTFSHICANFYVQSRFVDRDRKKTTIFSIALFLELKFIEVI